jgi:Sec-independent protein secretion pathway component TatC
LCILYEVGILVARGVKPRSEDKADATSEAAS